MLDVCVGLGYNSAALMRALSRERSARLLWWGLEIDERPMAMALKAFGPIALEAPWSLDPRNPLGPEP